MDFNFLGVGASSMVFNVEGSGDLGGWSRTTEYEVSKCCFSSDPRRKVRYS